MDSIKLKHPITVNGKKRSKLNYNAEEITGDMYAEACKKARENTNGTYETAEIDYTLQLYIGFESIIAVNSDIDLADLEIGVRGPDLVKIAGIGRTFLSTLGRTPRTGPQTGLQTIRAILSHQSNRTQKIKSNRFLTRFWGSG